MALKPLRWLLLRDVVCGGKTGTLIVRMGSHYLYWRFEHGWLCMVHATQLELSFRDYLCRSEALPQERLVKAAAEVTEEKTLGAVLVQRRKLDPEVLRHHLKMHWISLCPSLFDAANHVFWSDQLRTEKAEVVEASVPFSQILLSCDRSAIDIRSAMQFAGEFPALYRVGGIESACESLPLEERKLIPYLKRHASLEEIRNEPELSLLSCYRALFVLWLAGVLQEARAAVKEQPAEPPAGWRERLRAIPPEWIIPFAAGALIGVLLAPTPEPPPAAQTPILRSPVPAWSDTAPGR